ncbi:MAG: sigma factor-like helix-turn-helix DNA-binding protein [Planctomycetota bacterium]|jgi:hypothetical protein
MDRQACERRVFRLAMLLLGGPNAAARVIEAVVDAQPDLGAIDSAHLDRLTVLRSRELRPRAIDSQAVSQDVAEALAGLPVQVREAWVFTRVYQMPPRETAKAMDCSVTATQRHLAAGDGAMSQALGPGAEPARETLLRFSMSLDVPAFYRARKRQRLRRRRLWWAAAALLVLLGMIATLRWWASAGAGPTVTSQESQQ